MTMNVTIDKTQKPTFSFALFLQACLGDQRKEVIYLH